MKYAFAVLATSLLASPAFSYTLSCASADSKIQYQYHRSDGGAAMLPSERLTVGGEDVINATSPGGATYRIGKIEFEKKQTRVSSKKSGDYQTTRYIVRSIITANDGKTIAADFLRCTEIRYTGAPRP